MFYILDFTTYCLLIEFLGFSKHSMLFTVYTSLRHTLQFDTSFRQKGHFFSALRIRHFDKKSFTSPKNPKKQNSPKKPATFLEIASNLIKFPVI